ncbi:MAG: hypothetical protein ABI910_23760 [Gemmatimonadota bacterium]
MPVSTVVSRALRIVGRTGAAVVVVVGLASSVPVFRSGKPPQKSNAVSNDSASVSVNGLAYWDDDLLLGPTAVLHVRLLDLLRDDRAATVVASHSAPLHDARRSVGWSLQVPRTAQDAVADGFLVISISDGQRVRYVGTESAHGSTLTLLAGPRAAPNLGGAEVRSVQLQRVHDE